MVVILNIIVLIIGIFITFQSLKLIFSGYRSILLITLIVFELEYVLPLIVETFWYLFKLQSNMFPAIDYALCDKNTNIIYSILTIILQIVFFYFGKKSKITIDVLKYPNINKHLFFFFKCLRFLPLITVLLSPNPIIYFASYAPFVFNRDNIAVDSLEYHSSIVMMSTTIAFASTMFVQLFRKHTTKKQNFVQYFAMFIYCFINGKRTLLAFSILGFILIEMLKSKKINVKKILFQGFFIIAFFIIYSLVSGKGDYYGNMNLIMNYILYFDRAFVTKVAIYDILNKGTIHILDYPLQTLIFNFFFYVPRTIWSTKPYPYAVYFTSGVVGNKTFSMVPWRFQTSVYAEWISNLGMFGIFVYVLIFLWFVKKTEKKKNFLIYFIGLMFACFMQVFEFTGTPQYMICLWILLIMLSLIDKKYIKYSGVKAFE